MPDTESPGIPGTRHPQKYLTLYEHESIEVQKTEAYQKVRSTPWAQRVRPHFKNHTRHFYTQIFPHDDAKP